MKRFINADGLVSTGVGVSGYNMFAYCNNNPVNLSDPTGACAQCAIAYRATHPYPVLISNTGLAWADAYNKRIYDQQVATWYAGWWAEYNRFHIAPPTENYTTGNPSKHGLDCDCSDHNGSHNGRDYDSTHGPGVIASADGKVTYRYNWSTDGNVVVIEWDHAGNNIELRYAHLNSFASGQPSKVEKGALIGIMGSTGRSTGVHLHLEMRINGRIVDPEYYIKP